MKKLFLSFMLVALSAMAFAQKWTSISKDSATSEPSAPVVKLISSSENEVVIDFSLAGFNLTRVSTPNGVQNIVSVPKMATSLDAGTPNLPHFPVPVLIGDLAEMSVTITDGEYTDFNVEVAPSKGNFSRQIDPSSVPYTYGDMYGKNEFYPATQAHLDAPYILRDFRGQNIVVTPFAYNPVTKTLRVYHHFTIDMKKVGNNGENPKMGRKSAGKMDPEMRQTYSRRFINFSQNAAKYNYVSDRGEMLVICADQFMDGMQEFVDWKNQSGRPTTMVSVTQAGGNNDNAIKNYINGIYTDPNRNLQFVLFVGDYEHITPHAVGQERSDNWFGQLEGTDHYEEVIIGRFSVQSNDHLANHVNKVLYYERDMKEGVSWVNKGLGIGEIGAGSGHYGEDDYQHIDFIRDTLEHYTYEHVTDLHGGYGGGASQASISATINDGVSIINYCNHGSETSWGVTNYSNSNVNALVNDNKWPFIWSVACLCGKFNYGSACFAEAWMRATNNTTGAPTGAIGGMFSWMSQPWIPPMYGQDEMVNILTEWHNADKYNHTFGGASVNGNLYVIDMSGSGGYDTHDTWILFGDPTLMVRTDNPASMNLTVTPSVFMLGMTSLEINAVNTDYGIATLSMNGEVISTGSIHNGTCNLQFAPLSNVGTAILTVMGYNKVTEIIEIPVNPAEGPYVVVDSYESNFAPVNSETSLSLTFKNVGVDPTNGTTTVALSCTDDRMNITNGNAQFASLAADATTTLDGFSYIIAEGVADGTKFQIDIEMTCGSTTWNGKAIITAGQAILEYAGAMWDGNFTPGQHLTLVANFSNLGHYMATNAVASISSNSEYISIVNQDINMGTIDPNGTASCVFEVVISENCPETAQIPVDFVMEADGGLTANGQVVLKNACNVVFELKDSYGDGWNGNKLVVAFSDGTPNQQLTIDNGYSATYTLEIGNGVQVTLSWINGQFSYECSFTVSYEGGEQIYAGQSGVNYTFTCNCAGGEPLGSHAPVENLNYTMNLSNIALTWDAPEGAIGYIVSRNGLEIGETVETSFTDEVAKEGFYTYCVVAKYNDGQSYPECISTNVDLGIEESMAEFAIYPNPTRHTLFVNGGNAEYSYEMYNGMGQMVTNGKSQGIAEINVGGMAKGVYFLRLTSGSQVRMEKVVVE